MITDEEKAYLNTIRPGLSVSFSQFDPLTKDIARSVSNAIRQSIPEAEIRHLGASGLEIAGQNDIDLYFLSDEKKFAEYRPKLIKILGEPESESATSLAWKFEKNGFDIEFYLTDPNSQSMRRQLMVFDLLKNNPQLLKEYEELKISFSDKTLREYQRAKYEFYNYILGL